MTPHVGALPFLYPNMAAALHMAYAIVTIESVAVSYIRCRCLGFPVTQTVALVIGGVGLIFFPGIILG